MSKLKNINSGLPEGWQENDVTANGIQVHYYRIGTNSRPLVFAHGITDNGLCWTRLAKALEQNHDLIMVDARGHGKSDKPETGYSPREHAKDLAGLIEALNLEKPVVIGHSMGGMTAALVAAERPDLIKGTILEDPPWFNLPESVSSQDRAQEIDGFQQWVQGLKALSVQEIVTLGKEQNPTWSDDEFPAWAESKKQVAPQVKEYMLDLTVNWQDIVQGFHIPVLLITADSGIVNDAVAQQAASLNARLTTSHIKDAGHNIRREQFSSYVNDIQQFLLSLEG